MFTQKSIVLICIIVIQISVIITVVFKIKGHDGIIKYEDLKQKLTFLKEKNARIELKNKNIEQEINFLQDSQAMDEYARESMSMVGEGEVFLTME